MKILAKEDIRSGDYRLTEGDTVTVPDEIGARWVGLGWAEDVAGVIPTGERSTTPRTVSLASSAP